MVQEKAYKANSDVTSAIAYLARLFTEIKEDGRASSETLSLLENILEYYVVMANLDAEATKLLLE